MQLNDLQKRFKDRMLDKSNALSADSDLLKSFEENGIKIESRLGVYQNNILENMTKVLEITYPTIHALVGEEFFKQVAYTYVRENPPSSGDVNLYGENFPDFIASLKQTETLPYLGDVARYEWAINKAYYADNDTALTPEALKNIEEKDYENICFTLRSSVSLLHSPYAVDEIKEFALKTDEKADKTFDITKAGSPLLIFRPELQVRTEYLEHPAFITLTQLQKGLPIGKVLNKTLKTYSDFDFQQFLQFHLTLGTFANFHLKEKE